MGDQRPDSTPPGIRPLRVRHKLGKYRICRKVGEGGFATVYDAVDSIEGIHVAVKVPHAHLVAAHTLAQYRKEARVHAALDHPNILPIKTAEIVEGRFVIVYPLGTGSLADRMRRRMSVESFVRYAEQMLDAIAHAHERSIIHCDIKPENFILFPDDRLRLSDFGIAKVAARTVLASGSGTVGYVAPEQAMGRASFRSDVFSLGLVLYSMLSRELPEWPFRWPPDGIDTVRRKVPPEAVAFLQRALHVDQAKRFADARRMRTAFGKLAARIRRYIGRERRRRTSGSRNSRPDWKTLRFKQFAREYRAALGLDRACRRCGGPLSEAMAGCPWCGAAHRPSARDRSAFPARCPRCRRGRKLDWSSCAWCYGPGFDDVATRSYSDRRYVARCDACRHPLLAFSRYCPGCRRKVRKPWRIEGSRAKCGHCGWGIVQGFWNHCPWCRRTLEAQTR